MFKNRGLLIHPEELNEKWLNEISEAGLNLLGLHPVGGIQAAESLEKAIHLHCTPGFQKLLSLANKKGITVEYEAHALSWLLPRGLFELYPDWFSMNENGERVNRAHLCVSNEDALRYIGKRAAFLALQLDTGAHRRLFWLDDGRGFFCKCEACKGLSPSDQCLIVTNAILKGIKKVDVHAQVPYLAYEDTLPPPQNIVPEEGVFLEFAPFSRDHYHHLNDPDCSANSREIAHIKELLAFFGAHGAQALDYWTDNSKFSNWKKPPQPFTLNEKVMEADLSFYHSLGFESVTAFACYLGDDYQSLYGQPPIAQYGRLMAGY